MSARVPDRTMAGAGVDWSARRWDAGNTTEGWRDKRAHLALRSVGCFCWVFRRLAHLAPLMGNVRRRPNPLYLRDISHIAGPRHVR